MTLAAVGVARSSLGSAVAFSASGAAVVSIATFVCMVLNLPSEGAADGRFCALSQERLFRR